MKQSKLLRQILSILLSVSMILEPIPGSVALAAENTVIEEAVAGESMEENGSAENNEVLLEPEAEPQTQEAAVEETVDQETTNQEIVDQETVTEVAPEEIGAEITETEGAENAIEGENDTVTPLDGEGNAQAAVPVAEILVDELAIDNYLTTTDEVWRKLDSSDLAFITTYQASNTRIVNFQNELKNRISIKAGEETFDNNSSIGDYDLWNDLTFNWVKKTEAGDVALVDTFPEDAGEYALTISLASAKVAGLYDEVKSVNVALTIEKADVEIGFTYNDELLGTVNLLEKVVPGTTVAELIAKINQYYSINYINGPYSVGRELLAIEGAEKNLPITVYVVGEDKSQQAVDATAKFDRTKDYVLKIGDVALTTAAAANYVLSVEDYYVLKMGDRLETKIKYTRKDESEIIKTYAKGTSWKIEDAIAGIFADEVKDAAGNVTKAGAPTVFSIDGYGKESVVADAAIEAKWYTRERVDATVFDQVEAEKLQKKTEDIPVKEPNTATGVSEYYIYKPMEKDPEDAGEYYIIWYYAGDNSAYEESDSRSKPVKCVIDPISAVLQINAESVGKVKFSEGMDAKQVAKAIAKIDYDVFTLTKNDAGEMVQGTDKVALTPEFFGTSFAGDEQVQALQYYVPEFVLQRRISKIKEKGAEAAVAVDEKAVDWEKMVYPVKAVVENKEFNDYIIDDDYWPLDIEKDNVDSVEYEFRIYFTGYKVLYTPAGTVSDWIAITDVTTNAANRNYLIDATKERLDKSAVAVTLEQSQAVKIVTDAILDSFIKDNADVLDPQVKDASAEEKRAAHPGTLLNPAVKIYDRKPLFVDRASYKKAEVYEDKEGGSKLKVASTDDALTYEFSYATLEEYESYLAKYDEAQREYADFEAYTKDNPFTSWAGITNSENGSFDSFEAPGIYRLVISYEDPDNTYRAAEAELVFRVERQEVIIVAPEQYARIGESIGTYISNLNNHNKENKKDYIIYKLPHNSMEEFAALADDAARKAWELPMDDEIAAETKKNGIKPDMYLDNLQWKVLRKVKNAETGEDTDEWVEATGVFEKGITYGVAVNWAGMIEWLDKDAAAYASKWVWDDELGDYKYVTILLDGSGNDKYTTKDVKTYRQTGEEKHHESISAVKFYDGELYVEADSEKIKALTHEYDGNPVDLAKVAEALTFYTDREFSEASKLVTADIVNTTDEYDPAKVNIYWEKVGKYTNTYSNKNAVYGGTYALMLRFEGGALGTSAGAATPTEGETAAAPVYRPLDGTGWVYPYDRARDAACTFEVTPHKITIAPKLVSSDAIKAGDLIKDSSKKPAKDILAEGLEVEGLIDKDKDYFAYSEIATGAFDITRIGQNEDGTDKVGQGYVYRVSSDGGYPAFSVDANSDAAAKYIIQIDDKEIENPSSVYLRYNSKYTVKLKNELASPLAESYSVTYKTASVTVTKRGSANISSNNYSNDGVGFELKDSTYTIKPRGAVKFFYSDEAVTVKDRNGEAVKLENTNIFGFEITAPDEFRGDTSNSKFAENSKKFIYKNSIYDAGGYILSGKDGWADGSGRSISVVFPLTEKDKDKSFTIVWEDGYAETFKLTNCVLVADLKKAVAPKSLKFNNVSKNMTVGETQQLDVKITKAQLGDVISIRYRIKGGETKNEFISLNPETGAVTALKAGKKATVIEAYAVCKDAEGNIVPVKDSKGKGKVASTKITVKAVSASSVKKVVAQDVSAKVYFKVPDNGYRREFYVIDVTKGTQYANRAKWKAAQFNKAIDEMKNGQWEEAGFAIAPVYSYADNKHLDQLDIDQYDRKLKAHIKTLYGFEAGHSYIVYVRNVSQTRALEDGSVVALSASGGVKKFKVTKPQVKTLELGFTVKSSEKDKKNTVTHPVDEAGNILVDEYTVELSAKKAKLNVYGYYSDKDGGNAAAEINDTLKYSLIPTVKAEKAALKKYQKPKLQFAVYDYDYDYNGYYYWNNAFKPGEKQSKYATVNSKGQITLKGTDLNGEKTVYIYVRDALQHNSLDYGIGGEGDVIALTITSKPAKMQGKTVNMKVGQTIRLADYIQYKDAKKKTIPNYRSCGVTFTKEEVAKAKENGFVFVDKGNDTEHDWWIQATAPTAKSGYSLKVTDYDADHKAIETTVKLKVAQIDSVKNLKVSYVDDKYITITFTHPSNKPANSEQTDSGNVYDYKVEVKDARGNLVDTVVLASTNAIHDINGVSAKELKKVQSWIQLTATGVYTDAANKKRISVAGAPSNYLLNYYTDTKVKTKTFAYTYQNEKLVRLSQYSISVTPLYDSQKAAKAVTVKTKTKNIPASHENIDLTGSDVYYNGIGNVKIGGQKIVIGRSNSTNAGTLDLDADINDPGRFVSGNTYTLKLDDSAVSPWSYVNADIPRDRVTDKLTWKSSNSKVAKIKANAGTYTATLNTLKKGKTVITVSSKVTKKVIARWLVTVNAVEDGSTYGGKYEPTWYDPTWGSGFYERILALYDPDYRGKVEVLSENENYHISSNDEQGNPKNGDTWVSFTAPHYGEYTLTSSNGVVGGSFYDSKAGSRVMTIGTWPTYTLFLEANQKIYFKVSGSVDLLMTGTELARLTKSNTKANPLEIKRGYVAFTAWEDNVYSFSLNGRNDNLFADSSENIAFGAEKFDPNRRDKQMLAGETQYIYAKEDGKIWVSWCEASAELAVSSKPSETVTLDKDNHVKYVSFAVNETGRYSFTYDVVKDVNVDIRLADGKGMDLVDSVTADSKTTKTYNLKAGSRVIVEIRADMTDALETYAVSVTVAKLDQAKQFTDSVVTIAKGTTDIAEYVIPAYTTDKARFKFVVTGGKIKCIYDADYNPLYDPDSNEASITVPLTYKKNDGTGKAQIKAGDKIYIKVEAGDTADAELKASQTEVVPFTTVPETKTNEIDNNAKIWYTFTAPSEGIYEFGVSVDKAEESNPDKHNATIRIWRELFEDNSPVKGYGKSHLLNLRTGEKIAIELDPDSVGNIKDADGNDKLVKSVVNVSVKAIDILPMAIDTPVAVDIKNTSDGVRYYSFTAVVKDNYTVTWTPEDKTTDFAKVTYYNDKNEMISSSSNGVLLGSTNKADITINYGNTYYFKVENGSDDFAVKGNLTVVSENNRNAELISEGVAYEFHLEDKDDNDDTIAKKVLKFIAPKDGYYVFATTVGEDETFQLPYKYPVINGESGDNYNGRTEYHYKGEVLYFVLTFDGKAEDIQETKGTFSISYYEKAISGDTDVSVKYGVTEKYTFVIPEAGRYDDIKADYDKEKAIVSWNYTGGSYFSKNDRVVVWVTGNDKEAAAAVKLHAPSKITTTALVAGENAIAVKAGEASYYEMDSENAVGYFAEISDDVAAGKVKAGLEYVAYSKDLYTSEWNNWKTLSNKVGLSIPKNGKLLIRATSAYDKKDAECKLTLVGTTELVIGENPITIKAGESVKMMYRAKEDGYYGFALDGKGNSIALAYGFKSAEFGDKFNKVQYIRQNKEKFYTLYNEGSEDITLTVVMKIVTPIPLNAGEKSENVVIPAGEYAVYALKTFKNANYGIMVSDTSKGENISLELTDRADNDFSPDSSSKRPEGKYLETQRNAETILKVTNNGLTETTVTVELSQSEAQALTDAPITLGKEESKLISFMATEDNRYIIAIDNDNADINMSLKGEYPISPDPTYTIGAPSPIEAYQYYDVVLKKGDKLVYKLSYNAAIDDTNKADSQTVNVKIAPVSATVIEAEATSVEIAEKAVKTAWYQFTAKETAMYTFSCEDANENNKNVVISFYSYMLDNYPTYSNEVYLKAGQKTFLKVDYQDAGSYKLKYKASVVMDKTGAETLDFSYPGETQEVKFIVPKGGIYKVSGHAIRGAFGISARTANEPDVGSAGFSTAPSFPTKVLMAGDIMTVIVVASKNNAGKASMTLRIDEVDTIDAVEPGKEMSGITDSNKSLYYETRIAEAGIYAITTSGAATVNYTYTYTNKDNGKTGTGNGNGTSYIQFEKGDRLSFVVSPGSEKAFAIKVEKVVISGSLDAYVEATKPKDDVTTADNLYYDFAVEKAYMQCTVPANKRYYYAIEPIVPFDPVTNSDVKNIKRGGYILKNGSTTLATGTAGVTYSNGKSGIIPSSTSDQGITFELIKPASAEETDKVLYKITFREAAVLDAEIKSGDVKPGVLAANENASYTFEAEKDGTYMFSFVGSSCYVNIMGSSYGDSANKIAVPLKKGEKVNLSVYNNTGKAGIYELKVEEQTTTVMTAGTPAVGKLDKNGGTAYLEFKSTETSDDKATTYQVYSDGQKIRYIIDIVDMDADGNETGRISDYCDNFEPVYDDNGNIINYQLVAFNWQIDLKKNQKMVIRATNDTSENENYKLTVKELKYAEVKADTPVSGTLDAIENGYFEFEADKEATYKVSLLDKNGNSKVYDSIKKATVDGDGKLGEFGSNLSTAADLEFKLNKGDKLQLEYHNNKLGIVAFDYTVSITTVPELSYTTLELGKEVTGKLTANEKAGYVYTASDAAEAKDGGTKYVAYFYGAKCEYKIVNKDADGKDMPETDPATLSGSQQFTLNKDAKIRFTVSGTSQYSIVIKKVSYATLTEGKEVKKLLKAKEEVYYEFASGITEDKVKEVYDVFGSDSSITFKYWKATTDENNKVTEGSQTTGLPSGYSLGKGEALRFSVKNTSSSTHEFTLVVEKQTYEDLKLDETKVGRLTGGRKVNYQFTSTAEEATWYQIYGTAKTSVNVVVINEDKSVSPASYDDYNSQYRAYKLSKGKTLRITVSSSYTPAESDGAYGYNLTLTKFEEKKFTLGAKTETGSLGYNQKVVYVYKNEGTADAVYALDYPASESKKASISVSVDDTGIDAVDYQRIKVSVDSTLKLVITPMEEGNSVAFTVSEFQPDKLTLGTLSGLKKITQNEAAYYQYEAAETGTYVLTVLKGNSSSKTKIELYVKGVLQKTVPTLNVTSIDLIKDDVLWIKVVRSGDFDDEEVCPCKVMLSKEPAEVKDMADLPFDGSLNPGEVKFLKFTVPDEEKAKNSEYILTVTGEGVSYNHKNNESGSLNKAKPSYNVVNVKDEIVLWLANTKFDSISAKAVVTKQSPIAMGKYPKETDALEPKGERCYVFPAARVEKEDGSKAFAPYYISVPDSDDWGLYKGSTPMSSGMYEDDSSFVATVRSNNSNKACRYEFELKEAVNTKVEATYTKAYNLGKNEAAYFTIAAPTGKTLYVTVDGENLYTTRGNTEPGVDNVWNGTTYGVTGETVYIKVRNNKNGSNSFTLRVVEDSEKINLELDKESVVNNIPANAVVNYEFTAPENGDYVVVYGGAYIAERTYKDGEADKILSQYESFRLKANEKIIMTVKADTINGAESIIRVIKPITESQTDELGMGTHTVKVPANGSINLVFPGYGDNVPYYMSFSDDSSIKINGNTASASTGMCSNQDSFNMQISNSSGSVKYYTFTLQAAKIYSLINAMEEVYSLQRKEAAYIEVKAQKDRNSYIQFSNVPGSDVSVWDRSSLTSSDRNPVSLNQDYSIQAGNTYYYRVAGSDSGSSSFGVKICLEYKYSIEGSCDETEYTLQKTEVAAYEIKAPSDENLLVQFNSSDDVTTTGSWYSTGYSDGTKDHMILAGETYSFNVKPDANKSSSNFKIKIKSSPRYQINSADIDGYDYYGFELGETKFAFIQITVPENEYLTINFNGDDDLKVMQVDYYGNSYYSPMQLNEDYTIPSTTTRFYKVVGDQSTSVSLRTYSERTYLINKELNATYSLEEGEIAKFQVTAPYEKNLFIQFSGGVNIILTDESYTYDNGPLPTWIPSGNTYYYKVIANNETDLTVNVEAEDVTRIYNDKNVSQSYTLNEGESAYFMLGTNYNEFGILLQIDSEDDIVVYSVNWATGVNESPVDTSKSIMLNKWSSYYYRVKANSKSTFTISTTRTHIYDVNTNRVETKNYYINRDELVFVKLNNAILEDLYIRIDSEDDVKIYVVDVNGNPIEDSFNKGTDYQVSNSETKYLMIAPDTNKEGSSSISIKTYLNLSGSNVLPVALNDPPKTVKFNSHTDVFYLTMQVDEEGYYNINGNVESNAGSDNADFYVEYINAGQKINVHTWSSNKNTDAIWLNQGDTLYVKVYTYDSYENGYTDPYDASIDIKVNKVN